MCMLQTIIITEYKNLYTINEKLHCHGHYFFHSTIRSLQFRYISFKEKKGNISRFNVMSTKITYKHIMSQNDRTPSLLCTSLPNNSEYVKF